MSNSMPAPRHQKKPTADELAGTPVCKAEENNPVRTRGTAAIKARGPRGKQVADAPTPPTETRPTADELAGIPVSHEGEEEIGVRPRKSRRRQ
jgi:hypothetical protein